MLLLGIGGVFNLATGLIKDGLKVCIDDDWCISKTFVLVKFYFRLFGATHCSTWSIDVKSFRVQSFVLSREDFLQLKLYYPPQAKMLLFLMFSNIYEQTLHIGDSRIMSFPIK